MVAGIKMQGSAECFCQLFPMWFLFEAINFSLYSSSLSHRCRECVQYLNLSMCVCGVCVCGGGGGLKASRSL